MEQFHSSPQQPPQIPLFIENLPQGDEELSKQNINDLEMALGGKLAMYRTADNTIPGNKFLELYRYAQTYGVSNKVLLKFLKASGVEINSHLPPENTQGAIRYH